MTHGATPSLRRLVAAALLLGLLDGLGRVAAASRLGLDAHHPVEAAAIVALLTSLALAGATLTRPDARSLVAPAIGLLVVGDVLSQRLELTGRAAPTAFGVTASVATAAFLATTVALRDLSRLERHARTLGLAGLALIVLPLVPGVGAAAGGAHAWISVAGWTLAPGELGRPLVLLGMAAQLVRLAPRLALGGAPRRTAPSSREAARAVLAIPAIAVIAMLAEGDAGPAAVMVVAVSAAIGIATGSWRYAVDAAAGLAVAFVLAALVPGRVHTRIVDLLHPLRYDDGGFTQAGLAHFAVGWSGWRGTGLGAGLTARSGAIPAQATDYVLGIWTEETGALGLALVLGLLAWLLCGAWSAARRTRAGFDAYAACGLASLLTVHTLWICAAVLGWLPLTGITTPLVSAGGSGQVGMAVVLGLLVCAQPAVRRDGRSSALSPDRTRALAVAAGVAVTLLSALAIATAVTVQAAGESLNRRPDNPLRAWATLRRGQIRSADGRVLALTVHGDSLDRIARRYRHAQLAAGLVGHTTSTDAGDGVEEAWGAMLRCGGSGQARISDRAGALGVRRVLGNPAACRPADVVLTLRMRLQRAARAALGARHGAAVVLDARTGAVLAAYGQLDSRATLRDANPALALSLAPGSTFKLVVAAAALHDGVELNVPFARGYQAPGGRWLRNAGDELCGGDLEQTLAVSCNSAFAELAHRLGFGALERTAARFGFGGSTTISGIQIAASGVATGDERLGGDQLAASGIGQGHVTATPLQMAEVGAAIANGGAVARPRLVAAACADGRALARTHASSRRVVGETAAATLARSMRAAVLAGTGRSLAGLPGRWAAKTGTAEIPRLAQAHTPAGTAAWMVAFPLDPTAAGVHSPGVRPVIAALVLPDAEVANRWGAIDAADTVRRLARALPATPSGRLGACVGGAD